MNQTTANLLKGKKILIATVAADGHFNPLTGLCKLLSNAGCDVRWYTSAIYKNRLDQLGVPNYPFVKAKNINGRNLNEIFPERNTLLDAGEKVNFDMIHVFIKPGPDQFQDILDIRESFCFDAVITDNMFPALPYISAKLVIPVISIGIIPLPESSNDLSPYGPGFYPPTNELERVKSAELRTLFNEVVYKPATDCLTELLDLNQVPYNGVNFFDILTKAPDLHLQIGVPSFEYHRSKLGSNIKYIGALLPYRDSEKESEWYDDKLRSYKNVILVTQGTIEGDVTKLITPTIEAFKNTDILVIVATGGFDTEDLKSKYSCDNVIIEDYIPFSQVMPFTDVFITNGGYGGTLLAIQHQLPIVGAGLYEGKAEVCARVGHFEYGIDLKTERPLVADIASAVRTILDDPKYKLNVKSLSKEMGRYQPEKICLEYIHQLLSTGVNL